VAEAVGRTGGARRSRRRLRRAVLAAGALSVLVALWAFATRVSGVRAPQHVVEPVAVYVVYDSWHRGLALPHEDGGFAEFGFGEWEWYARRRQAWYRVIPALLWPTRGTLGLRRTDAADGAALRRRFAWARFEEIVVERAAASALRDRLAQRFAAREHDAVHVPSLGFTFVPDDTGYWGFHNCHDAVAHWLRDLGCRVDKALVRSDLRVVRD